MTSDSASVRRVLVLSPNWLGDAVMALPAIADVRRRFRDARLIVAARRSVADLFTMAPDVDQVVALEWKGHVLGRSALRQDTAAIRALDADAAILLPNAFSAAWLVRRAGIRERWGYAADFRRLLLSRAIQRPRRSMHQAEYYQHLVRALGMESGPLEPTLLVPDDAMVGARTLLNSRNWSRSRPLVAMAPGAAYGTAKRWLPGHYANVASSLVRTGAQCVLVGSRGRCRDDRVDSASDTGRSARTRARPDWGHDLVVAGGRDCAGQGLCLQRLGRDARGRRRRHAGDGDLRADARVRDAAAAACRCACQRADSPGLVPALYAAGVSDRSPMHEGTVS